MNIRNVAIIAHVDHGKTTLVDALLKQSRDFRLKSDEAHELIMDTNELERERGITIFSKNASVRYKDIKINIIDTPGHADFGGEVERIMRMADGVLLLVDAKEGPMPQTKFVLRKAVQAGHKVIVVINKIDKTDARPQWALERTYELFIELGASNEQIDFPVVYAAGALGKAGPVPNLDEMNSIEPLFEVVVKTISEPEVYANKPLQFLSVNLAYDNYKGKIAIGRLFSGVLKKGMRVAHITRTGEIKNAQITSVMLFDGLKRIEAETVQAGDIAAIAGVTDISIGETISDVNNPVPLPVIHIDEPTIKMTFGVNTSPFMGTEGQYTTSRNLNERLQREIETDVALRVEKTESPDRWVISGRGELHLAILIEKMRREGYELEVSKPQVIFKESDGKTFEPIELVSVEVHEKYQGTVIEMMGKRLGELKDMYVTGEHVYLDYAVPTRSLIGVRNEFLTATRGTGVMNSIFLGYELHKGHASINVHGSLISSDTGESNSYGLIAAQVRGTLFIGPGIKVYEGMVIGENSKAEDLKVNICKAKELTNFRSKNQGIQEVLEPPREMGLEDALEYIGEDELVEVTPRSVRIRKALLSEADRKRAKKKNEILESQAS